MRYIPNVKTVRDEMLREIGFDSIDQLFEVIPDKLRLDKPLGISEPIDEFELLKKLKAYQAEQKTSHISFLGGGAYRRLIPSAILPIVSRAEFLTSYTPYQPEISQGTLQVMFEFQSLLSQLTGMDIANASMYECATAVTEAALMALRLRPKATKIAVSKGLHPDYLETLKTYLHYKKIQLIEIPLDETGRTNLGFLNKHINDDLNSFIFPTINFFGVIEDIESISNLVNNNKVLSIAVISDMSSLGLLKPPGDFGIDIVAGEGQSLGLPVSYGGPYLGIFACKKQYLRQMPGRLSGMTDDINGKQAFCLTLATREQHIRREKATSNICTNQALCALWVTIYLSLLGKEGLRDLAKINYNRTRYAIDKISGVKSLKIRYPSPVYNEFVIDLPIKSELFLSKLKTEGILAGIRLSRFLPEEQNAILFNITEANSLDEIELFLELLHKEFSK